MKRYIAQLVLITTTIVTSPSYADAYTDALACPANTSTTDIAMLPTQMNDTSIDLNAQMALIASIESRMNDLLQSGQTLNQADSAWLSAMLRLSSDIGLMADRIGVMADRIGTMSDRIVATQVLQSDNFLATQSNSLESQQLVNTLLLSLTNN